MPLDDYAESIANDPDYQKLQKDLAANAAADVAARNAAINKALAGRGIPTLSEAQKASTKQLPSWSEVVEGLDAA